MAISMKFEFCNEWDSNKFCSNSKITHSHIEIGCYILKPTIGQLTTIELLNSEVCCCLLKMITTNWSSSFNRISPEILKLQFVSKALKGMPLRFLSCQSLRKNKRFLLKKISWHLQKLDVPRGLLYKVYNKISNTKLSLK